MKAKHGDLPVWKCVYAFLLMVLQFLITSGVPAQVTWQTVPFPVSGVEVSALNMDDDNLLVAGFTNAVWYSWDNATP